MKSKNPTCSGIDILKLLIRTRFGQWQITSISSVIEDREFVIVSRTSSGTMVMRPVLSKFEIQPTPSRICIKMVTLGKC
jgi:hypothetical protein